VELWGRDHFIQKDPFETTSGCCAILRNRLETSQRLDKLAESIERLLSR
jgi:hypothetical protein